MRVTFTPEQSKYYGSKLSTVIRGISGPVNEAVSLETFEKVFHGLSKPNQTNLFSTPLWSNIVKPNLLPFSTEAKSIKLAQTPLAIIPDFKAGVDVMILLNSKGTDIEIETIDLQKGGLAANTAEALIQLGYDSRFFSIHGKGEIADFHESLLRDAGINPVKLIDSGRDAYIHPCTVESSDRKQEFWFVQDREIFPQSAIDEATELLKVELEKGSNEVLVLSAIPPTGSGVDYFTKMSLLAHSNGNPVIFNPKQYDHIEEIATNLFENGRVDVLKPNVVEFTQFLQYARILYGDERAKAEELKKEAKELRFGQAIPMARKLIHKYSPRLRAIFMTFSENGLLAVTPKHAVFIPAPKVKLVCSSGAGDSGIGGIIVEAKEENIDLRTNLHPVDLGKLGKAFNYTASATASLPGNTIADRDQIRALKSAHDIEPIFIQ